MPSTNDVERPQDARAVATRYLTRERLLSGLVALLVVSMFVGASLVTTLVRAVLVGAVLVLVVRAPLLQPQGAVRLRTDDDPDVVLEAFTGATPPVLALQWGIADEIATGEQTVTYRTSYLFGVRTVELAVETRTDVTSDGDDRVTLDVTANDRPWATYTATISGGDGRTDVEVEYSSNRRFGLRRLPQRFVANRYRDDALVAQGYTVVERESAFGS